MTGIKCSAACLTGRRWHVKPLLMNCGCRGPAVHGSVFGRALIDLVPLPNAGLWRPFHLHYSPATLKYRKATT